MLRRRMAHRRVHRVNKCQPGQTQGQVQGQEAFADPETIRQMLSGTINDLQAQIRQLQQSLNRTDPAPDVRQRSQASYRQMQMQLQQAQEMEQAFAMGAVPPEMMGMASGFNPAMGMGMPGMGKAGKRQSPIPCSHLYGFLHMSLAKYSAGWQAGRASTT